MNAIIVITAILLILVILGLVMAGEMKVQRTIYVKRAQTDVFQFLVLTKNHDKFSEWNMADPNMKREYRGTDGEKGFVYKWDSDKKNVGAGEQETTAVVANQQIDYELRFDRPMKSEAKAQFVLDDSGDGGCNVTWVFGGTATFPMSIMKPLMTRMLGSSMQRSLNNLKVLLES